MLWNSGHCGFTYSQHVPAVIIIVAVAGPEPNGLTVTQLYQRGQWIKGQKVMVLLRQGTAFIDPPTHPSICWQSFLLPVPPFSWGSGSLETALVYHVYFLITETESKNLANRHQARNKGNRSQAHCLSACRAVRWEGSRTHLLCDALQGSLQQDSTNSK